MSDAPQNPAAWHPDPFGRHELRYWDGAQWTEHVSNHGKQSVDQPTGAPVMPQGQQSADKVHKQLGQAGATPSASGGSDLLEQLLFVVNQKWKIFEINSEYAIYDQQGTQIGAVRQVGQSAAKKVLRLVSNLDQYLTHSLQIVDASGTVRLALTRPAKIFKSTIIVSGGDGNEIGRVVQENMIGKIRFRMEAGGQTVGSLNAENWRAWNFSIRDAGDQEVARVTKTWEGLAKTMFTTADNYVVQVHAPLAEPLRSLVVAAALCVDTALKQDTRGLS
jgi:uncharacterized protein YxjI